MTDFETDGLMMAINAFSTGDFDQARNIIEASPSMFVNNGRAQNLLGSIYARMGDMDKATSVWEAALMIEPRDATNFANSWANLTGAYLAQTKYDEAVKAAGRALDSLPDHMGAKHNRALAYQALKEFDKALADLNDVVNAHPDHSAAWLAKGICESRLDDPKAARLSVEKSLDINPMNPSSHAQLGSIYQTLGDNLMANDSFKRALELAPQNESLKRAVERTAS
ncbi:MAG: tetratricopeptide repeat protein [Sphaerospermopsis sp. SIO1G2]|nr:tetratricopeptide repeat protein [Sphaerospermopsis sp. SIO1G2]